MNYFNPYMPSTPLPSSMPQQYQMYQQSTPSLPSQQILKVNGEESVRQVRMSPNSSALAMDTTAPIVWLLVSDGVGSVTSTPYDITEHRSAPQEKLEDRIERLEAIVSELTKSNDEPNDRARHESKDTAVPSAHGGRKESTGSRH